jgi:hypothetical protein
MVDYLVDKSMLFTRPNTRIKVALNEAKRINSQIERGPITNQFDEIRQTGLLSVELYGIAVFCERTPPVWHSIRSHVLIGRSAKDHVYMVYRADQLPDANIRPLAEYHTTIAEFAALISIDAKKTISTGQLALVEH